MPRWYLCWCECMSIQPGMIVFPETSITRSTPAVLQVPTHAMRPAFTMTVPRGITRLLSIVMMRALVSAIDPEGRSRGTCRAIDTVSVCPVAALYAKTWFALARSRIDDDLHR